MRGTLVHPFQGIENHLNFLLSYWIPITRTGRIPFRFSIFRRAIWRWALTPHRRRMEKNHPTEPSDLEARIDKIEHMLLEVLRRVEDVSQSLADQQSEQSDYELMSLENVAKLFLTTTDTIVRWVDQKILPARRIPAPKKLTWRFLRREIERFIEEDCF